MLPEPLAFKVGQLVRKLSGYAYPGIVAAAFHTQTGYARYVVEHRTSAGMLHIFSGSQLEPDDG